MDNKKIVSNTSKDVFLKSTSKNSESRQTQVFVLPPELLKGLILDNKKSKAKASNEISLDNSNRGGATDIKKSPTTNISTKKENEFSKTKINENSFLKENQIFKNDINDKIIKNYNYFEKKELERSLMNNVCDNILKNSSDLVQIEPLKSNVTAEIMNTENNRKINQNENEKMQVNYFNFEQKPDRETRTENGATVDTNQKPSESNKNTCNELLDASSLYYVHSNYNASEESDNKKLCSFLTSDNKTKESSQTIDGKMFSENKLVINKKAMNTEEKLLRVERYLNFQQRHEVYSDVPIADMTNNKSVKLLDKKINREDNYFKETQVNDCELKESEEIEFVVDEIIELEEPVEFQFESETNNQNNHESQKSYFNNEKNYIHEKFNSDKTTLNISAYVNKQKFHDQKKNNEKNDSINSSETQALNDKHISIRKETNFTKQNFIFKKSDSTLLKTRNRSKSVDNINSEKIEIAKIRLRSNSVNSNSEQSFAKLDLRRLKIKSENFPIVSNQMMYDNHAVTKNKNMHYISSSIASRVNDKVLNEKTCIEIKTSITEQKHALVFKKFSDERSSKNVSLVNAIDNEVPDTNENKIINVKNDEDFENQPKNSIVHDNDFFSMKSETSKKMTKDFVNSEIITYPKSITRTNRIKDSEKDTNKVLSSAIKIKSNKKITEEEMQNIFHKLKKSEKKDNCLISRSEFSTLNKNNKNNAIEKNGFNNEGQRENQEVTKSKNNIFSQNVQQSIHLPRSCYMKETSSKMKESIVETEKQSSKNRRKSTSDLICVKTKLFRIRNKSSSLDFDKYKNLSKYHNTNDANARKLNDIDKEANRIQNDKISITQINTEKYKSNIQNVSSEIIPNSDNSEYDDKKYNLELKYVEIQNNECSSLLASNGFNEITDINSLHLRNTNFEVSPKRTKGRPSNSSNFLDRTTKNVQVIIDDVKDISKRELNPGRVQVNDATIKQRHTDSDNIQKRKRGRPPKRTTCLTLTLKSGANEKNSNCFETVSNISSIESGFENEDSEKKIKESDYVIRKRKTRHSKSEILSPIIFSKKNISSIENSINSSITSNNDSLSYKDVNSVYQKRKGRSINSKRTNSAIFKIKKQSHVENAEIDIEGAVLHVNSLQRRRSKRLLKTEASNSNSACGELKKIATYENVQNFPISTNKDNLEDEVMSMENSDKKDFTLENVQVKRRGRPPKLKGHSSDNKINKDIGDMDMKIPIPVSLSKRKKSNNKNPDESDFKSERCNLKLLNNGDLNNEKESSDKSQSDNDDERNIRPRRKRKCPFNIYEERKRGRPKGSQRKNKCDDDYVPHHSQLRQSFKKKNTKLDSSSETTVKKMISCGKCKKEMLKVQWAHHNLSVHNDLGWLEGTSKPNYENDEKLVKRVLFNAIKKRKGHLVCEICNVTKRSVLGFLSHTTFCGKDEDEKQALMVTCPVCKAITKPSSLEYHERMHKMQAEEKQRTAFLETEDLGIKVKRKAAEKAVTKISEFTALVKDDKENKDDGLSSEKKLKLNYNFAKKLIQKPQLTKRISSTILGKWKKDLDIGKKPNCSQVGCQFTCESLDEIKQHYSMCNFTPQENFVCKICHFQSSSENEIIKHAVQKHSAEDNDDTNLSISDIESSNSENTSDIDNDNDKNRGLFKKFVFKESTEHSSKMFKFLFRDGVCHTKYNRSFPTAFQWTLEFEQKNYKLDLFQEYVPNTFELLNIQESKNYLPELDESMFMKTIKVGNKDSTESEWKKWKRFEGQCIYDNPTFFVGGPVWALAWLPIPSVLAISENVSQFIAISTHSNMDMPYSVGNVYSGKNIIQIWKLGELNHKSNAKCNPELAYAIAHDGGTVWCLDWCPSGCYQFKDLLSNFMRNDNLKRMGLLAAACSDGSIRIYSLIFPEDLPSSVKTYQIINDCNTKYPIYKTEPALILTVNRRMYENKQQTWQVTKLSWTKENDHNVIVAGFSNGYVALWDLMTKSPMLKSKKGNTVFLSPYKHFLAHHHAITMVYLVPQDKKRFLTTASLDRYYKFWDLEDTSNPRNSLKKSFVTDGSWLNNWSCALIAYDDALSMNHNYSYCLPLREYTYKYYNIFPTNSTSYAIATSDFGNSIANGTLAGEVLAMFPQQLLYIRDMDKTLPRKRYISMTSSLEVVDFNVASKDNELPNDNNEEEKNEKIDYNYMPSSYDESKNRFGIKFFDKMNFFRNESSLRHNRNLKKTLTCEMMQTVPIEQYPFMSANRVSWNPNAWSFLWLAVGYQNGFVRLTSFKSMASTTEWTKLITSHIETLKYKDTATATTDKSTL